MEEPQNVYYCDLYISSESDRIVPYQDRFLSLTWVIQKNFIAVIQLDCNKIKKNNSRAKLAKLVFSLSILQKRFNSTCANQHFCRLPIKRKFNRQQLNLSLVLILRCCSVSFARQTCLFGCCTITTPCVYVCVCVCVGVCVCVCVCVCVWLCNPCERWSKILNTWFPHSKWFHQKTVVGR